MKLSKIIVAVVLFSGIFVSASEKKVPSVTISYTKKKPKFEDRMRDVAFGGGFGALGTAGNMSVDILKGLSVHQFERSVLYRSLLRAARVPLYAGIFFGSYLIGKGLLAPYYTSNWEWNIKTKNYEYSRRWQRPWYSDEQKPSRETIRFPRQK